MSSCSMAVQNLRLDSCRWLREAGRSDHLDGSSSGSDSVVDLAADGVHEHRRRGSGSMSHGVGGVRLADLPARVKTAFRNSRPTVLPDPMRKTLQEPRRAAALRRCLCGATAAARAGGACRSPVATA